MKHQRFWIFGSPFEEDGMLAADFYYQAGKHTRLHIPIPAPRFQAAGELAFQIQPSPRASGESQVIEMDLPLQPVEAGKLLFSLLGEEVQQSLIRSFANLDDSTEERILYLVFTSEQSDQNEWSLMFEDLPWEYLHDGTDFISNRYQIQIVRNHTREQVPFHTKQLDVDYWRILLVCPFVYRTESELKRAGISPLPGAQEEINALRELEKHTNGFIKISPEVNGHSKPGIRTLSELEHHLAHSADDPYHIIHFCGHGVMYEDRPCLCFEEESGKVDYVNVERLKQSLSRVKEQHPPVQLPSILFLNACGSSSRGKYSAGFASGLQDLSLCVIGYQTHVQDDATLIQASRSFYQSLCIDQPLQQAYAPSSVMKAVTRSRNQLYKPGQAHFNHACNMQVYLPEQLQFRWIGRGLLERAAQSVYSRFAEWMNPSEYTSHLSIVFFTAIVFGTLFGIENLMFVLPESVLSNYLNYTEIASELARIFMIGPLSFLSAAIWIAWISKIQYHTFIRNPAPYTVWNLVTYSLYFVPLSLCAGVSYSLMFSYSFSHLDLLTAKTKELAPLTNYSTAVFWYGLSGCFGFVVMLSLAIAAWICYQKRETLHNYNLYQVLIGVYVIGGVFNIWMITKQDQSNFLLITEWFLCSLINIVAFTLVTTKIAKETCWRSAHKRESLRAVLGRKLLPFIGSAVLVLLCYVLLEESVRFEQETIQWALSERAQNTEDPQPDYVQKVLERALRQRAISDVPERVRLAASKDWLLSIIFADHLLYLSYGSPETRKELVRESELFLEKSVELNPAVQYTDYYLNISAMVLIHKIDDSDAIEHQRELYAEAIQRAKKAVMTDEINFAYLDTLAGAQYRLAQIVDQKFILLTSALDHIRQAEWCAFFLRSPRAESIQANIRALRNQIQSALVELDSGEN